MSKNLKNKTPKKSVPASSLPFKIFIPIALIGVAILAFVFLQKIKHQTKNQKPKKVSESPKNQATQSVKGKKDEKVVSSQPKSYAQKGKDFLENKKEESGVQSLESGLLYKIIKKGSGKKPKLSSTVEVHYEGKLINGNIFDSSYKRNSSISFPLNQVIKGWQEGLQLMKEGAKYELFIPSELAYGARNISSIPAHSVLIFTVELLKVKN